MSDTSRAARSSMFEVECTLGILPTPVPRMSGLLSPVSRVVPRASGVVSRVLQVPLRPARRRVRLTGIGRPGRCPFPSLRICLDVSALGGPGVVKKLGLCPNRNRLSHLDRHRELNRSRQLNRHGQLNRPRELNRHGQLNRHRHGDRPLQGVPCRPDRARRRMLRVHCGGGGLAVGSVLSGTLMERIRNGVRIRRRLNSRRRDRRCWRSRSGNRPGGPRPSSRDEGAVRQRTVGHDPHRHSVLIGLRKRQNRRSPTWVEHAHPGHNDR